MSYPPSAYSNINSSAGPHNVLYSRHKAKRSISAPYLSTNTSEGIHNVPRTPPRSPPHTAAGPLLLPKIRPQDQTIEEDASDTASNQENWWTEATAAPKQVSYAPSVCRSRQENIRQRSSTPPDYNPFPAHVITPDSADGRYLRFEPPQSRSTSDSNLDAATIRKYLYPSIGPIPQCPSTGSAMASLTASGYQPVLSSQYRPNQQPQVQRLSPSPQPRLNDRLAPEYDFDTYPPDVASTTLSSYLASPNPTPNLVPTPQNSNPISKDSHFWWDVRNVRPWTSFTIDTIRSTPGFNDILNAPIPEPALPNPAVAEATPKSVEALHELYSNHFCTKINAGLKALLGSNVLTMLANAPVRGARSQPNFITVDSNNSMLTQQGEMRGRCVGIVKTYADWDSGMRDGKVPAKQVKYLRELSHLHRCMREHQARYGFLVTEIELICVRAGTEATPYFGHLELAKPIPINSYGPDAKGGLTACLALWYLNALCLNTPLRGQPPWDLQIGPPAEHTRAKVMKDKDPWLVKPHGKETRNAKSIRGWIYPTDPPSKKEQPKSRRKR